MNIGELLGGQENMNSGKLVKQKGELWISRL